MRAQFLPEWNNAKRQGARIGDGNAYELESLHNFSKFIHIHEEETHILFQLFLVLHKAQHHGLELPRVFFPRLVHTVVEAVELELSGDLRNSSNKLTSW